MNMSKSKLLLSGALVVAALVGVTSANADTVLVDRGLPTANLNNAAGADRSNVAWAFGNTDPTDYWVVGDTFTNTSSGNWLINTIELWTLGPTTTATLWGGVDGSAIAALGNASSITATTYAGGVQYQGSSGSYLSTLYQVDFSVNITLAAGQTYDFFLDGTGGANIVPYVSASNAALSGSPQDQADNSMLYGEVLNGSFNPTSIGTWTSLNNGWDKASDVNVAVIGAVPEPETYAMLLAGLGLLGFMARRRKEKETAVA